MRLRVGGTCQGRQTAARTCPGQSPRAPDVRPSRARAPGTGAGRAPGAARTGPERRSGAPRQHPRRRPGARLARAARRARRRPPGARRGRRRRRAPGQRHRRRRWRCCRRTLGSGARSAGRGRAAATASRVGQLVAQTPRRAGPAYYAETAKRRVPASTGTGFLAPVPGSRADVRRVVAADRLDPPPGDRVLDRADARTTASTPSAAAPGRCSSTSRTARRARGRCTASPSARATAPSATRTRRCHHPSIYDDFDAIMAAGALLRDAGATRAARRRVVVGGVRVLRPRPLRHRVRQPGAGSRARLGARRLLRQLPAWTERSSPSSTPPTASTPAAGCSPTSSARRARSARRSATRNAASVSAPRRAATPLRRSSPIAARRAARTAHAEPPGAGGGADGDDAAASPPRRRRRPRRRPRHRRAGASAAPRLHGAQEAARLRLTRLRPAHEHVRLVGELLPQVRTSASTSTYSRMTRWPTASGSARPASRSSVASRGRQLYHQPAPHEHRKIRPRSGRRATR